MTYVLMATALAEDLRARGFGNVPLGVAKAMVARMFDRAGEIARRVTSEAEAYDSTIERTRQATRERGLPVAPSHRAARADDEPPCRCATGEVDLDGSCMRCGATQGEACRRPA